MIFHITQDLVYLDIVGVKVSPRIVAVGSLNLTILSVLYLRLYDNNKSKNKKRAFFM